MCTVLQCKQYIFLCVTVNKVWKTDLGQHDMLPATWKTKQNSDSRKSHHILLVLHIADAAALKRYPPLSCAPPSVHFLPRWFSKCCPRTPEGPRGPYRESTHPSDFLVRRGPSLPLHGADMCIGGGKALHVQIFFKVPISFTMTWIQQ